MQPLEESKLPTLRLNNSNRDVNLFLHSLLNYHLPDGDQLPTSGSGAQDFGPRTQAKVKAFQVANKIDFGAADFADGVVGPHTWAKLLQKQQVTLTVTASQSAIPIPPPLPPLVRPVISPPRPPLAPIIPVPKLQLSAQFQVGEQGQFPTNGRATASHSIQIVGVILNRNDKDRFHAEGQIGPGLAFNRGGNPGDSKTDLGFNAVLNLANLPGSQEGGRFSWSQTNQFAIIKSLNRRSAPAGQLSAVAAATMTLLTIGGVDVIQITAQAGGYLQAEAPNDGNGNKCKITGGALTFFGFAGTFAQF